MPTPPDQPELTPAIVADDQALGDAIGELAKGDAGLAAHSERIRRRQGRLMARLPTRPRMLYLAVEEATNERLADLLSLVVRWAFSQGRRYERQRKE